MVKPPSFDSNGMKKGAWNEEEDNKLRAYVMRYGDWNWRLLPKFAGLARCGKSCRLRWVNYLNPGVKRGNFSKEEKALIIKLHAQHGNKWSAIAAELPGRTDNEIKNFYHTRIEKRHRLNPAAKKVIQHGATEASYKDDQVMDDENASEITHRQKTPGKSAFSETTSLNKLQQSTLSIDANASLLPAAQSLDTWPDIFQADTNYNQTVSFPPLIEEGFFYPELHCSELSSSDSSYMSAVDWIADDDHSTMSSEHVAPAVQECFWSESSASNTSNSQSESLLQEMGELYDPLFEQCFDME